MIVRACATAERLRTFKSQSNEFHALARPQFELRRRARVPNFSRLRPEDRLVGQLVPGHPTRIRSYLKTLSRRGRAGCRVYMYNPVGAGAYLRISSGRIWSRPLRRQNPNLVPAVPLLQSRNIPKFYPRTNQYDFQPERSNLLIQLKHTRQNYHNQCQHQSAEKCDIQRMEQKLSTR